MPLAANRLMILGPDAIDEISHAAGTLPGAGGLLRTKEDGFALECFDGEEQRDGGIDAGRYKNQDNGIPVVGAGHDLLANQASVEDGNEGELRSEIDAGEQGRDGGNDHQEGHGCEIALRFFVALGKERDGHQHGGKEYGQRKSHQKDRCYRLGTELQQQRGAFSPPTGGGHIETAEHRKGNAHGEHRESGGSQGRAEHQEEFSQNQVQTRDGAGENGLHGSTFFFPSGQIDRRIHRSGHAQEDDEVTDEAADGGSADFFRGSDVLLLDGKGRQDGGGDVFCGEAILDDGVAIVLERFLDAVGAQRGFQFSLVEINLDGLSVAFLESALKSRGNFDRGANFFFGDLFFPVVLIRSNFQGVDFPEIRQDLRGVLAAEDHDFGRFLLRFAYKDGGHRGKPNHDDGEQ